VQKRGENVLYSNRLVGIGSLALALLIGTGAMVSYAHQDETTKTSPCDIGVVDMERIYNASDAPNQFNLEATRIESEAQICIDGIAVVPDLSDVELKEYSDLIGKSRPDAIQQKRIEELKKLSDSRQVQLNKLLQTKQDDLTNQDKAQLKDLNKIRHVAEQFIPVIQEGFRRLALEREDSVKRTMIAQLRGEVGKVAKEKKIAHVFDVNALVYSTNDLTQIVIQKLDKHSK
jgi:hypothetical protein